MKIIIKEKFDNELMEKWEELEKRFCNNILSNILL